MPIMKELIPHADEPKERPEQITDEVIRLRREKARLREALQSLVDWGNTLPEIASEKQRAEYDADYARAASALSALPND